MPPSPTSSPLPPKASTDTSHMLPAHREKSTMGPIVGAIIIILVLALGALYFWGAQLNKEKAAEQLPLIPAQQ